MANKSRLDVDAPCHDSNLEKSRGLNSDLTSAVLWRTLSACSLDFDACEISSSKTIQKRRRRRLGARGSRDCYHLE